MKRKYVINTFRRFMRSSVNGKRSALKGLFGAAIMGCSTFAAMEPTAQLVRHSIKPAALKRMPLYSMGAPHRKILPYLQLTLTTPTPSTPFSSFLSPQQNFSPFKRFMCSAATQAAAETTETSAEEIAQAIYNSLIDKIKNKQKPDLRDDPLKWEVDNLHTEELVDFIIQEVVSSQKKQVQENLKYKEITSRITKKLRLDFTEMGAPYETNDDLCIFIMNLSKKLNPSKPAPEASLTDWLKFFAETDWRLWEGTGTTLTDLLRVMPDRHRASVKNIYSPTNYLLLLRVLEQAGERLEKNCASPNVMDTEVDKNLKKMFYNLGNFVQGEAGQVLLDNENVPSFLGHEIKCFYMCTYSPELENRLYRFSMFIGAEMRRLEEEKKNPEEHQGLRRANEVLTLFERAVVTSFK